MSPDQIGWAAITLAMLLLVLLIVWSARTDHTDKPKRRKRK